MLLNLQFLFCLHSTKDNEKEKDVDRSHPNWHWLTSVFCYVKCTRASFHNSPKRPSHTNSTHYCCAHACHGWPADSCVSCADQNNSKEKMTWPATLLDLVLKKGTHIIFPRTKARDAPDANDVQFCHSRTRQGALSSLWYQLLLELALVFAL